MDVAAPAAARAEVERLEALIVEHASEGSITETAALHFRAAQICLCEGGDADRALEHLWTSWRLLPDNLDARLVLSHCLERDGRLADLAEVCRQSAEHIEDTEEQVTLLCRATEMLLDLGEISAALAIMQRMPPSLRGRRAREQRRRTLRTVAEAAEHAGKTAEAVAALTLLGAEGPVDERFELAMHRARLQEHAGDRDAVHAAYLEALRVRPAAPEALEPVLRRLAESQAHEELTATLAAAAQAARQGAERAELLRRQAEHCESTLHDASRAADLWFAAWQEHPQGGEAARLKQLYAKLERWDRYHVVLLREVVSVREVERKVAVYRELATFQREVTSKPLEAARTYGLILQLLPDDEAALAARLEIFEETERTEAVAAALRRYAGRCADVAQRDLLLRRLARHELRQGRQQSVMRVLQQLEVTDAENLQLVGELRAQLQPQQDRELAAELGLLLLKLSRAQQDAAACAALAISLAQEAEGLGELGRAADFYRQALEFEPEHSAAHARLRSLTGDELPLDPTAADLAARAEALAERAPTRAVRLLLQATQVERASASGDDTNAMEYLRRALELCPPEAAAEGLLLEEALRAAERHEDLVRLLRREAEREEHPARRKSILRHLAVLYEEQLRDPAQAVETLEEVLALDPKDGEAAEQMRRLYSALGNHAGLAHALDEQLVRAKGPARVALLEEVARLYARELKDDGAALERYGELLSMAPDHAEALAFCRAHDEAAGDHRAVALLLSRAAEAAEDPLDRAELHREIAEIAEHRLADQDFAIAQWTRVVELCPADAAPRAELRRLLAAAGRWREVEAALLAEVSRSLRPEEKVPTYCELARIAEQQLQDDHAAASYLRLAQQLAPGNRDILTQIEPVYERLGMWRELATALRRHAELEPELDEKLKQLHRAARVLLVRLKREEEALAICRYVRELRPGDRVTATLMGEIFGKRGQWRERIALLREQIANEADPLELGRLHLELGHLLIDRLSDVETASQHFEQALELDGGRGEVLPLLRRLYESQGRWDQLVDLIRRRASAETVEVPERAAALCEIGRIREVHQNDPDGAREAYERAIHLDAGYLPALTALRALALRRGQWRDLVALGRRALQATEDGAERARILLEIAEILQDKMSRPSAAMEALEEALTHDAGNLRAAERLANIYFESEEWERAGQLLEKVVESGLELKNLHEYYYRLGFATERLGREDDAFSCYVKSFGREPMYLPTLDRLVELCYVRRQWDNTLRIAEAIVTTYEDQKTPAQLAELYLRVGLCEIHLAQRDAAVGKLQDIILEPGETPTTPPEAWLDTAESWAATALEPQLLALVGADVFGRVVKAMERALMHASDHPGPLQVLAAMSLALGDWERALRYLERTAESTRVERRHRAALLICAGDVAANRVLSPQRAEAYYRRAQTVLPGWPLVRERLEALQISPSFPPRPPPPESRTVPPPLPGQPPRFRPSQTQPLTSRTVSEAVRSADDEQTPPRPPPIPRPSSVPRPTPRSKPRKDE
jgi:Tfp pilus assembly protein PilF